MAANLTTTYVSQILDLLGLSKFKGGGQCPPAPPIKISLDKILLTFQIPSTVLNGPHVCGRSAPGKDGPIPTVAYAVADLWGSRGFNPSGFFDIVSMKSP